MGSETVTLISTFLFSQMLALAINVDEKESQNRELFKACSIIVAVQWFTIMTVNLYTQNIDTPLYHSIVAFSLLSTCLCINFGVFTSHLPTGGIRFITLLLVVAIQIYGLIVWMHHKGAQQLKSVSPQPVPTMESV